MDKTLTNKKSRALSTSRERLHCGGNLHGSFKIGINVNYKPRLTVRDLDSNPNLRHHTEKPPMEHPKPSLIQRNTVAMPSKSLTEGAHYQTLPRASSNAP